MGGQLAPRVINGITFNPKKTSLLKNAAQPEKQNIFMKNGNESRDVPRDVGMYAAMSDFGHGGV